MFGECCGQVIGRGGPVLPAEPLAALGEHPEDDLRRGGGRIHERVPAAYPRSDWKISQGYAVALEGVGIEERTVGALAQNRHRRDRSAIGNAKSHCGGGGALVFGIGQMSPDDAGSQVEVPETVDRSR